MRTFIAVPIPRESLEVLETMQRNLRSLGAEVRWTAITSIHLTLKFLGEIDPVIVPRIAEAVRAAAAGVQPLTLTLQGLGGFPGLRNIRVVWCGIQGETERLSALQRQVEATCAGIGFPSEERPFQPHLTLGRVKGTTNLHRLVDYIKIGSPLESTFVADCVHVYESVLSPRGSQYRIVESIELGR